MKKVFGYVESDEGEIVIGRLGLKVYKSKQAIKDEGFSNEEISYVKVEVID